MIINDRRRVRLRLAIAPRRPPILWLLVLAACVVAGCDQPSPWQRDVYVLQRVHTWTPAVGDYANWLARLRKVLAPELMPLWITDTCRIGAIHPTSPGF